MSKRYCEKCGTELPEDAEFCPKCGEPVKPDENDSYEEEPSESDHSGKTIGIIIAVIVIAAICIGAGFFFLASRQDTAADQTADQQEQTYEKKEKTQDSSSEETEEPEETEKAEATTTTKPTEKSDVLESTDDNTQTVTAAKTGTVYISEDVTGPRRIKVRTAPSMSAGDTGMRKYDGDRVTVYETKFAEGYSWYRIGDNQWIRGDDEYFGVNFDH